MKHKYQSFKSELISISIINKCIYRKRKVQYIRIISCKKGNNM